MVKIDDGVYYCDPSKHTECTKTGCFLNGGTCRFTLHEECADTTVDIAPVVHAHWIKIFEDEDSIQARCSACGMVYTLGKGRDPNYCGTCGAKMDEVKNG